ncbi:uncharacterized protein LOC122367090 [Amphibalanus amphitrite]|uniref:uncharacterized protein LOC122367090 n=1 Tax=Amphibalanus amphitrite TaxID=1232801 RepID=UPI001C921649|nr:uncharacterized protein LOC122367090 [Amphibalanus amphitrite]
MTVLRSCPGGCLVVLVAGVIAALRSGVSAFGQVHFFDLVRWEEAGCLPEQFEQHLPPLLWVRAITCRRESGVDAAGRPLRPDNFSHDRALYLHCLAEKLGIVHNSGISYDKVDAFLDSLPGNTSFISRWKTASARCRAVVDASLTAAQQGVFLLTCLRQRMMLDCATKTGQICLSTQFYTPARLSETIPGYRRSKATRLCPAEVAAMRLIPEEGGTARTDLCPQLLQHLEALAACTLRKTGQASSETLNLPAVREAVRRRDEAGDQYGANQQMDVLERCQSESVDSFVRCWVASAPEMAINNVAHRQAMALDF